MRAIKALLVVAIGTIVWLSASLVRVENERYALTIGMCWDKQQGVANAACLRKVQTRSGWYWHLFYALTG